MTTIEIPDEQATVLRAKAAALGYTLESWLKKLADGGSDANPGLNWSRCSAVESVPERLGGAWVFKDTRMPVSAVFENLEDGITMDELIELYDGLTREQVEAVLDFAARSLEPAPNVFSD